MRLVLFVGPLCVFNYNVAIELWVMETENNQNVFSISITHNSKIRELSGGNKVMKTELSFAKQAFCYGAHHFWIMSYGNWELSYGICQSKQPLRLHPLFLSHLSLESLPIFTTSWWSQDFVCGELENEMIFFFNEIIGCG